MRSFTASMQPLLIMFITIFLGYLWTVCHIFNLQSCKLHQLLPDNLSFLVLFILLLYDAYFSYNYLNSMSHHGQNGSNLAKSLKVAYDHINKGNMKKNAFEC